ncbi:MAG TPA: AAA family ATPase [Steroidobacteraceae bacterium]|nr:AAA family ATPase [Steroidobacteraceae bacterium]
MTPSVALLEREQCLADLAHWLAAAAKQRGCIVLVHGEAGIGKTTLLQEFSKPLRTRVLWGACDALFTPRPLGPLHDIARQAQGALLTAVNSGAKRDAIFNAALDELERIPTLAVFEDMHWADDATLDLLKYLGRRIERTRSMLVVTYRDDEVGLRHPLRSVIGDLPRVSTHRMALDPLSESAVAALAGTTARSAKELHRVTGGNPFFVTEVLATDEDTVPVTVREAVLAHFAKLSADAREIAELVSVVPGRTEDWLIEEAAGPTGDGIESCLGIGMVRHEDGSLAFRHELARRALEDSLSPMRQQALHSNVLAVLVQRLGIPVARLVHHADGARNADQVLRFAPIAASHAASVGAHSEAAAHYRAALRYANHLTSEDTACLHEQLSYECYLTSQHLNAIEASTAALEVWRASGARLREGDTLRCLSRLQWFTGRRPEARQHAQEAVTVLKSLPAGPELAMAYGNLAHLDVEAHRADSAIAWARRAIELAEGLGRDDVVIHALGTLGLTHLLIGDDSGWAEVDRGMQLARASGSEEEVGRAYSTLCSMSISRRKYEQAARFLAEGLAFCEERDLDSWWIYMLAGRARKRFEQSDWLGASEDVETVLRHPRATAVTRSPALEVLAHLRIRRGDPDADTPLAEARALAGAQPELQRLGRLAAVSGEAAWLAGDQAGVVRAVRPVYDIALQHPDPRMRGELAALLFRVDALPAMPTDAAEPYASEISGNWRRAAQLWKALGCAYEHASVLGWNGREAEQRRALTILDELGAAPAAAMVRRRMREQGVRSVPRGSRESTRANPHGLTKREAEILELLAAGLRNSAIAKRLFLSTKTVDHHVSAVLAKLGVPSRAEAAALIRKKARDSA